MKQEFTKEFFRSKMKILTTLDIKNLSFIKNKPITLCDILDSEMLLKNKYYFVYDVISSKEDKRNIDSNVAEILLPLFKGKDSEKEKLKELIELTKGFLRGDIYIDVLTKKRHECMVITDNCNDILNSAITIAITNNAGAAFCSSKTGSATNIFFVIKLIPEYENKLLTFLKNYCNYDNSISRYSNDL